jgi:hypothetical protein
VNEVLDELVGAEIEQVWVWWSLRLVVDLNATYVDVTNFHFTDSHGLVHAIRVAENPEAACIVLSVLHRTIASASISDGTVGVSTGAAARELGHTHSGGAVTLRVTFPHTGASWQTLLRVRRKTAVEDPAG